MAVIGLTTAQPAGLTGVNPNVIYVLTNDTYATVTATGYLTGYKQEGFTFSNQQMALVYTTDDGPVWLKVAITYSNASVLSTVVSLVAPSVPGSVTLPTVAGDLAYFTDTAGTVADAGILASSVVSKIAANTFSGAGQIILAKASATESGNAVTASGNAGFITTSALTTAAGSTYSITWTNTKITATSVIGLTIQGGTNTVFNIQFSCVAGAGSATLVIRNIGPTNALNGTIIIGYSVL
jgi:hypothetical protein